MARNKKSLFDWLTGGGAADRDLSFDDLESGSASLATGEGRILNIKGKSGGSPAAATSTLLSDTAEELEGELSVDVYQTPTHIVIKAMIAGVRPEDLDVSLTRDMVTIRGKRERHTEGGGDDFFFQELYWGSFSRTIVLPQEVEIEEAEASEKHGLLTIRLPKLDKGRHAKLKVKSN